MSEKCEFSCFECPALDAINRDIVNGQRLVDDMVANDPATLIKQSEERTDDDVSTPIDHPTQTDGGRKYTNIVIRSLESAVVQAKEDRTAIVKSCTDERPYISRKHGLWGKRMLRCGSALGHTIMQKRASKPFTD